MAVRKPKRTKRKPPTAAQMIGRIPKWLVGFEQRLAPKFATIERDIDEIMRRYNIMLHDSKEAREDNLTTLPRLREYLERIEAMQREHMGTIAAHCQRLLREKVTLQRQLAEANRYMSVPVLTQKNGGPLHEFEGWLGDKGDVGHSPPVWCPQHLCYCTDAETSVHKFYRAAKCAFESTHRIGIRCGVCGRLEPNYGA